MSLSNGLVFMVLQKPEPRPITHCNSIYIYNCLGNTHTHVYYVTCCSLQCHFDEEIYNGEVGKMEKLSGTCAIERGESRDSLGDSCDRRL